MVSDPGMDGYFTGTDYPAQLVQQMTPAQIVAAAAWQGVAGPDLTGPFRMLDIGCGKGAALALAAASHPSGQFQGIDGMQSHIAAGQAFAGDLPNLTLEHATFDQALASARDDADLIVMHGVLSWAGPTARQQAMDLAAARLKPGGLLAASYNALPGGARQLAFQHMIRALARAGSHGGSHGGSGDGFCDPAARFRAAFGQVRQMADAGFDAIQPEVLRRLTDLAAEAPTEYFLHEYMHDGWTPFWAADVKAEFAARGLVFAGSVDFLRMRPDLCLTFPQAAFAEAAEAGQMDLLVDMGLDVVFRSDLYARAPVRDDPAGLRKSVWLGAVAEPGARAVIETPGQRAAPDPAVVAGVLAMLVDGPLSLTEILGGEPDRGGPVLDAVEQLLAVGHLLALAPPSDNDSAAHALNARLAAAAATGPGPIPVDGLAGRCGPVHVAPAQIARLDAALGSAPDGPDASLSRLGARLRRLGITGPRIPHE